MGSEPRTHPRSVRPLRPTLGPGRGFYGFNLVTLDLLMVGASTPSSSPTSCTSPLHTLRCSGASRRFSHAYLLRVCTLHRGSIPKLPIVNASCARERARVWCGQIFKSAKRWKGGNLIHPLHGVGPCKLEDGRGRSWPRERPAVDSGLDDGRISHKR